MVLIWLIWTRKTGQWRPLWVLLSIIGYSCIANVGEIYENDFKKNIQILNDRRKTSVPYFSSKYWFTRYFDSFYALISFENDALKFFIVVILSINFSIYRINSSQFSYFPFGFEGRLWALIVSVPDHCLSFYISEQTLTCRKIYKQSCKIVIKLSIQTSNSMIVSVNVL